MQITRPTPLRDHCIAVIGQCAHLYATLTDLQCGL